MLLNAKTIHFHTPTFPNSSASDLTEQIIFDSQCIMQSNPDAYGILIEQYVKKAFDWLQKKSIELSTIGNICNILSYTNDVRLKEEFCVRLVYCLGFALEPKHHDAFATKVNCKCNENVTHTRTHCVTMCKTLNNAIFIWIGWRG